MKNAADEAFHTPTPDGAGALNYTIRRPKGVRRHRAMEFTAFVDDLENRTSTCLWQYGGGETFRGNASDDQPAGVFNVVLGSGPEVDAEGVNLIWTVS